MKKFILIFIFIVLTIIIFNEKGIYQVGRYQRLEHGHVFDTCTGKTILGW